MSRLKPTDSLEIINGPEDGNEFPIVRAPFYIGSDPRCEVTVVFDAEVEPCHAFVSVVSDGYRIRQASRAPVWVNGKRAGRIRSRVLRDGDRLKIGETVFALACAPEGLAHRSEGAISETDIGWAIRQGFRIVTRGIRASVSFVAWAVGQLLTSWLGVLVLLVCLYVFWPAFRWYLSWFLEYLWQNAISRFLR